MFLAGGPQERQRRRRGGGRGRRRWVLQRFQLGDFEAQGGHFWVVGFGRCGDDDAAVRERFGAREVLHEPV